MSVTRFAPQWDDCAVGRDRSLFESCTQTAHTSALSTKITLSNRDDSTWHMGKEFDEITGNILLAMTKRQKELLVIAQKLNLYVLDRQKLERERETLNENQRITPTYALARARRHCRKCRQIIMIFPQKPNSKNTRENFKLRINVGVR